MYINPFAAGILITLFTEAIILIGCGLWSTRKDK